MNIVQLYNKIVHAVSALTTYEAIQPVINAAAHSGLVTDRLQGGSKNMPLFVFFCIIYSEKNITSTSFGTCSLQEIDTNQTNIYAPHRK